MGGGKLYIVTTKVTAYYWSEAGESPDGYKCRATVEQELALNDDFDVDVAEFIDGGWSPGALVYGDHGYDLTLNDALDRTERTLADEALAARQVNLKL